MRENLSHDEQTKVIVEFEKACEKKMRNPRAGKDDSILVEKQEVEQEEGE